LKARPEPTQLEHLSDTSFLGKLLVLQANVRIDWKVLPGANTLAYFDSSSAMKKKSFITLATGVKDINLFYLSLNLYPMLSNFRRPKDMNCSNTLSVCSWQAFQAKSNV
jgi:hypothetical protein